MPAVHRDDESPGLLIPWTGEVIAETPTGAVLGLTQAATLYQRLRGFQEACRQVLRDESDHRGQRTFEVDGAKVEVESIAAAMDVSYDAHQLDADLEAAGCPRERINEAILWEPRVNRTVLRQLAQNPAYAKCIESAITGERERPRTVRVR